MKKMLPLICLSLAACDGGLQGDRRLQRGMTEQEVTQLQGAGPDHYANLRHCHAQPVSLQGARLPEGAVGGECRRLRGRARKVGGEPVALSALSACPNAFATSYVRCQFPAGMR